MPPKALPQSAREKLEQSRLRWLAKQPQSSASPSSPPAVASDASSALTAVNTSDATLIGPDASSTAAAPDLPRIQPEFIRTQSRCADISRPDDTPDRPEKSNSVASGSEQAAHFVHAEQSATASSIPQESLSQPNRQRTEHSHPQNASSSTGRGSRPRHDRTGRGGGRSYNKSRGGRGHGAARGRPFVKRRSNVVPLPTIFESAPPVSPSNASVNTLTASPSNPPVNAPPASSPAPSRLRQPSNASPSSSTSSSFRNIRQSNTFPHSDGAGDSKATQLSMLDRDLSNALHSWDTRRSPYTSRRPRDSTWAFMDETNVSDFEKLIPEPAVTFPFELDDFQKRAIYNIDSGRSVFVAAHTSAGKTVVAEYAIALAGVMGGKAFYTSPIKSLSNQKLRDFRKKFDDVGLVTGDVSINETAQCVIMTTEILRSMLYRGADVIRDVRFVIFDEVQFLNDEERGVVWEESIIMLPPHIGIVMLSATVPNALEFSEWVGRTRNRQVAVVSTLKRPVPLKHMFLYPSESSPGGLDKISLLEQGGAFQGASYKKALSVISGRRREEKAAKRKADKQEKRKENWRGQDDVKGQESAADVINKIVELETEPKCDDDDKGVNDEEETVPLENENGDGDEPQSGLDGLLYGAEDGKTEGETIISTNGSMSANDGAMALKDDGRIQYVKGVNKNKGPSAKSTAAKSNKGGGGRGSNKNSSWIPLVRFVSDNHLDPTIVFCFSKKKCELAVDSLESSDLLPNAVDKAYVHNFFEKAVSRLRPEDQNLPQVLRVRTNLKRGISAHHAGLLPLVKEITEILFSEGYVKILFATETFAMGVNMPARAVVFSALLKHDGRRRRSLQPGEYTQMSGRAGRRGIDDVGHVFLYFPPDEQAPDVAQLRHIMTAHPISLKSAFRLTYNMILNVLRVDELRVEEMMKRSFSEANEGSKSETIGNMLNKADDTLNELNIALMNWDDSPNEAQKLAQGLPARGGNFPHPNIGSFVNLFGDLKDASAKLTFRDLNPIFRKFLKPGRLVVAEIEPGRLALAVVYSLVPPKAASGKPVDAWLSVNTTVWLAAIKGVDARSAKQHSFSVLLLPMHVNKNGKEQQSKAEPRITTREGLIVTLNRVLASDIVYICDDAHEISKQRQLGQSNDAFLWHTRKLDRTTRCLHVNGEFLDAVVGKWRSMRSWDRKKKQDDKIVHFLDEVSSSKREDSRPKQWYSKPMEFPQAYRKRVDVCKQLVASVTIGRTFIHNGGIGLLEEMGLMILEECVRRKIEELQKAQSSGQQPMLLPEYNNRVKVLEKLGYVGEDSLTVQLKGRCACEVATTDCVVLTEIIVENVLNGLRVPEIAALLSSLVCRKKNEGGIHNGDTTRYSTAYCEAKAKMREVVMMVGHVQEETGVELDFDIADGRRGYEDSMCRWDLADAVYSWASGEPFCHVATMTEQQEGDIVVCVKRLCELVKDTQSVAKGVGNVDLFERLGDVVTAIRRDVIFNGSLYYE